MRPIVMLFAKAPVPGRVKTRLAGHLGTAAATDLHAAFVEDMVEKLFALRWEAHLELHTDRPTQAWRHCEIARALQVPGDLGTRMYCAIHKELSSGLAPVEAAQPDADFAVPGGGRPQAMVVGGDVPTLPIEHLRLLLESTADVALGPSEDGGFYAIACRRVHPGMFEGVEWGSPRAFEQTLAAAQDCGLRVEAGIPWFDVDDAAGLERLLASEDLPPQTAAWRARWRR